MPGIVITLDDKTDVVVTAPSGQRLRVQLDKVDRQRATVSFFDPSDQFKVSRDERKYIAPPKTPKY